jgi:hypothetical protein
VTGGARLVAVDSVCDSAAAAWGLPLLTLSSSLLRRRFSRRRASSCTRILGSRRLNPNLIRCEQSRLSNGEEGGGAVSLLCCFDKKQKDSAVGGRVDVSSRD